MIFKHNQKMFIHRLSLSNVYNHLKISLLYDFYD
jgi:hypothetical protein